MTQETKHTAGKWKVHDTEPCSVMCDDGHLIAKDLYIARGSDVGAANARLIAAAPELLAQVQKYVDVLEVFIDFENAKANPDADFGTQLYENLCAAKAAIAKAKGE